uniref:Uncharacterized protein n=1 Tax=Brassica oleracea TaxID=3712 RepID=A0A3P6GAN1_BRAOL|nr:unnamed protein product [Brassica oleracea]
MSSRRSRLTKSSLMSLSFITDLGVLVSFYIWKTSGTTYLLVV